MTDDLRTGMVKALALHEHRMGDALPVAMQTVNRVWRDYLPQAEVAIAHMQSDAMVERVVDQATTYLLDMAKAYSLGTPESRAIVTATEHMRIKLKEDCSIPAALSAIGERHG